MSYYNSNFGDLKTAVKLSGYSGEQLQAVFSSLLNHAENAHIPAHVIHSSLDNSVRGIILPSLKTGAYAPEFFCQDEFNVCYADNLSTINSISKDLTASRRLFEEGRKIHDLQEKIYISNMDFNRADKLCEETISKLFSNKETVNKGIAYHRFFGAATAGGNTNYIPLLTKDLKLRFFIKGRPGTGKSTFLKKIAEAAISRGFNTEIYHCSLDSNSLDMVVVRDLEMCIFDSTAPHEYFPERDGDEIIDIYSLCVTPGTDEKYEKELNELNDGYRLKIKLASDYLKRAKEKADLLDKSMIVLSKEKLDLTCSEITERLFN